MSSEATSSKVTLPPKTASAQQCTICGYQWPWVVFNTDPRHQNQHLVDNICVRCQNPALEAWRWQVLRGEMRKSIKAQKKRYRKEQTLKGYPPLVKAAVQAERSNDIPRIPLKRSRDSSNRIPLPLLQPIPPPAVINYAADHAAALMRLRDTALAELGGQNHPIVPPKLAGLPTTSGAAPAPFGGPPRPDLPPEFRYAIPQDPTAPPLVMPASLRAVREPTRAMLWLQMHYAPAPSHMSIPQIEIFNSYRAAFPPPTAADPTYTVPQMHGADLIKLIPKCILASRLSGRGYVVEGLRLRPSVDPVIAGVLIDHLNSAQIPDRRPAQPQVVNLSKRQGPSISHAIPPPSVPPISSDPRIAAQTPTPLSSQPKRIRLEAAPFPMLAEAQRSGNTSYPSAPRNEQEHTPVAQQQSSRGQVLVPQRAVPKLPAPASTTRDRPITPSSPPPGQQPISQASQPKTPPGTSQPSSPAVSSVAILGSLRKKLIDLSSGPSAYTNGPRPLSNPVTPPTSQSQVTVVNGAPSTSQVRPSSTGTRTTSTPQVTKSKPQPIEIISMVDDDSDDEPAAPPTRSTNATPVQTPSGSTRSTGRPTWATANNAPEPSPVTRSAPVSTSSRSSRTVDGNQSTGVVTNGSGGDSQISHLTKRTGNTPVHASAKDAPVNVATHSANGSQNHVGLSKAHEETFSAPRSQTGRSQWDSPPPMDPPEATAQPAQESLEATELDSEDEVGAALDEGGAEDWWNEIEAVEPR